MQRLDPFPRVLLDRSSAARTDPAALAALWERPDAVRISLREGAVAVPASGTGPPSATALSTAFRDVEPSRRALLGIDPDGSGNWEVLPEAESPGFEVVGARAVALSVTVPETGAGTWWNVLTIDPEGEGVVLVNELAEFPTTGLVGPAVDELPLKMD